MAMPDWLPRLDGAWQLVFSAPNKTVPAWSYIPVNEDAVFDAGARTISLASDLGPLHFDFCGDFAWDARTQVGKQLLSSITCSNVFRTKLALLLWLLRSGGLFAWRLKTAWTGSREKR